LSEVYNPETQVFERLEALEVEARELARKRDAAATPQDRQVIGRQLQEVEAQIDALKRKLKP
jgi:hypothetical protein